MTGHGGVYCERNTERNTKKHPEIVLPPRKKLFYKAVLQATEDGSSLGRRRAGPGPCHGKKLLPSRYTVAQSVATCLLARHITPSVPRHAIGMPSASRHITKKRGGGVGGAEGLEYASTETEAATDCRYLDYDSNPAKIPLCPATNRSVCAAVVTRTRTFVNGSENGSKRISQQLT